MLILASGTYAQLNFLEGSWQGILTSNGQANKDGFAFWLNFKINPASGELTGDSRIEVPFTEYYAYKSFKGKVKDRNNLDYDEFIIGMQETAPGKSWCNHSGSLSYNDSTGYLTGSWKSNDCRGRAGKMILFRSKYEMSVKDTATLYHSWFNNFVGDLSRGWKAYYVRDNEMKNFEFVPVYFDHDKDVLKVEYESYLKRMVDIVLSHTDLRIKIIGHTDSNGTDEYNVDLSQRRAERIKKFLTDQGLPSDRVVIEYRGEKDPATSNATKQGKSLNRRVDFEFI